MTPSRRTRTAVPRDQLADPDSAFEPTVTAVLEPTVAEDEDLPALPSEREAAAGRARNTIIFSIATGLSRIAGLVREMVAAALYGGGALASAFTLAFQVPNLLRSLFADMALSAAFVPVFSELLEQKKRREALLLLSTLFWVLLIGLGALTAVAMLAAPLYVPLLTSNELAAELANVDHITTVLSQIMLPTVLLLGLNGVLVGALNAYDHFTIPAISPLVWNVVIIVVNLALLPVFGDPGDPERIYAQAIGVLVGTVVQILMIVPVLRRYGIRLVPKINFSDPRLRQVLILMVPVALSLGLINFSAAIDAKLGGEVSEEGPRAIEVAFRLYMLPQGVFSVAIVTVLFPVLSRAVARGDRPALRGLVSGGMAQILVMLVPVGLLFASPVIAHDIIQVLFQRGNWTDAHTDAAATALVWLGFCLALNGVSLLLSRTFFAMQRPWANTGLALVSLVANVIVSVALHGPLGIAGIIIGTLVGNIVLVGAQVWLLRRETAGPLGLLPVVRSLMQVIVASVVAVAVASGVALLGRVGSDALGDGTAASIVTCLYLLLSIVAGSIVYIGLASELRLSELEQAGGRFVRLGARLRAMAGRLPGATAVVRISRRPAVRRGATITEDVFGVLALPLRLVTLVASIVSRILVGLVPAGPAVAVVAGPEIPDPRRWAPKHGGPYDAAGDWPTIGQRPGDTGDLPWPEAGVPQERPEERPAREQVPGSAPATGRDEARRMLAEREAALERIAERERRRAEGPRSRRRRRS